MQPSTFTFKVEDAQELVVYRWRPETGAPVRAMVHIAHGMAEHAARYAGVAEALVNAGFAVYANDHRGHGRSAKDQEALGHAGDSGFRRMVLDLEQLLVVEKSENPGVPVILFGHSMGSFLVQALMIHAGSTIQAAVLSATMGSPGILARLGRLLARAERLRLGARGKSRLLHDLGFASYNRPFEPGRTPCDWLSRDEAEVDSYNADPLCGFMVTTGFWVDLLDAVVNNARPAAQARIPKDLPVYLFSGSEDPVGEQTRSVQRLVSAYQHAGLRDVTSRFYPGARHETLHETNRAEVIDDLLAWLSPRFPLQNT